MSKLAALLGGMTLTDLAKEILGSQGRGGDTELAHVNKREAALLKSQGGSGTMNPNTGMTEYQDTFDLGGEGYDIGAYQQPVDLGGAGYDTGAFQPPMDLGGAGYDTGAFVGQPTPPAGEGQTVSPPPESFDLRRASEPTGFDISTGRGMGFRNLDEGLGFTQGAIEAATPLAGGKTPEEVIAAGSTYVPEKPGVMDELERLAKKYPTASRAALAAALGVPGMVKADQARKEAAKTRREMEQMAAPIRAVGEQQLAAGQRGELTAAQQQQVQAARAAARQDLARRGVTSGTAAQMAENRIQELAQRFAQQNIDNGVRLIGAANSYSAAAIQQAYKMNADANAMTTNYFNNLMRAFGALPTETVTTTRTA